MRNQFLARELATVAFAAVALIAGARPANAADELPPGAVVFDSAGPKPTVDLTLSPGMFRDLFGLGDAAVAGMIEALQRAQQQNGAAEELQFGADQLQLVQQVIGEAQKFVRQVRVRVYKGSGPMGARPQRNSADVAPLDPAAILEQYASQLTGAGWEQVVSVQENGQRVQVSLYRSEGAVRGVFVAAHSNGGELALVNAVCELSPENVKRLTDLAVSAGLKFGLQDELRKGLEQMRAKHAGPQHE
jgi:hypothetical protein